MSQTQVAEAAGLSRAVVSTIERGLLEDTSLRLMRRVASALGISFEIEPRWRGAELARLLDERHAQLVQVVVARLAKLGWDARPECTFSIWGERGSVDILAWHRARGTVLCVEVKSRLADLQDLLSAMDRKRRLAPMIARAEGWRPVHVGSVLVVPGESWARNFVRHYDTILATSLPDRTAAVHAWLKLPDKDFGAIWFLFNDANRSAKRPAGGTLRVRPRNQALATGSARSNVGAGSRD
jgi:transcriptional regulator with XRE-family HTH domain